jgi:hypothetical protein
MFENIAGKMVILIN